jgi:hypothetical protein
MIAAAAAFDELILDLARFGVPRDSKTERQALFAEVTARWFSPVERLFIDEPYESGVSAADRSASAAGGQPASRRAATVAPASSFRCGAGICRLPRARPTSG